MESLVQWTVEPLEQGWIVEPLEQEVGCVIFINEVDRRIFETVESGIFRTGRGLWNLWNRVIVESLDTEVDCSTLKHEVDGSVFGTGGGFWETEADCGIFRARGGLCHQHAYTRHR